MRRLAPTVVLVLALSAFGGMLFARLGHPLLWQDEGETAMFASRILEFGYPKVHDGRNVVYEFGANVAVGVKESVDAYIGKTWGDFYFAVPGVWWARGAAGDHARTARLRLPFALAGATGLGLLLWGVLPWVPAGRRIAFSAAFAAVTATSISLLLHLRELRYYPLLVLVLGGMLALHARRIHGSALRWSVYGGLQALASIALFQVFYVGWFATTALLAADAVLASRRLVGPRRPFLLRALAPHALGAAAAIPALLFFETFDVATGFARDVGISLGGYLANLGWVGLHFLRHEQLMPALLARGAVALLHARGARGEGGGADARVAPRLLLFSLGYAAVGCLNPLVYERYFVVLSPLLTLSFLLDASALLDLVPRSLPEVPARRARRRMLAVLVLLALAPVGLRWGEVRGRLAEIAVPVRGPVDFVVAHLRERYAEPSALVIATNYEAHPLMYYLDSRVIVGLVQNNIAEERALTPDVVIPRRAWPRALPELRRFLARGRYSEERLPVLDTHYNNIPAVSASASTPDPHRFETAAVPGEGAGRLRVFHRVPAADAP
jgi:hypothetical protein